jgi:hypothetical protein
MKSMIFALLIATGCGSGRLDRHFFLLSGTSLDDEEERCAHPGMVGGRVEPDAAAPVVARRKQDWEASLGGEVAARPYVRARLTGWPARVLVDRDTLPSDPVGFATRLAHDTWRGLDAFTDREHQLPVDHVYLGETTIGDDVRVGDYTNVTTVGLHLIAVVAAHELRLIDRAGALTRITATLDTLDRLERHDGFFFNYYDTTSLERTSNFVSFVDSSWLTAGLMVVRSAFPELGTRAGRLIDDAHYGFFYDQDARLMSHGYWVHTGVRSGYHYGVLYAESRLGSLIAIGKGDVPAAHWFAMTRTFPAACRWQSQTPRGRVPKRVGDHRVVGGWYEWEGTRYVPSWGGSMFEALMPTLVVDERRWAPANLGANGVAHAEIQARYAREVLGYPVWGMSPSAVPGPDGYGEYGVRVLGSLGYGAGAVTPHASALALAVVPEAAVANLRQLVEHFGIYGEYGLYDAVEPRTGAVARTYLALDQAMTLAALANQLADGCIQRYFAADPIAARALPLLADEHFFD